MAPLALGKKLGFSDYFGVLSQLRPISEVLPRKPEIAERTTGEVMGDACEKMAARNGITRESQDRFAVRSHHKAAQAVQAGFFDDEITPVTNPSGDIVTHDTIIRANTSEDKLAKLRQRPVNITSIKWSDMKKIGLSIAGKKATIAIYETAPPRRHNPQIKLVAVRKPFVTIILGHLQLVQTA